MSLYDKLGVKKNARKEEIKRAFRNLAKTNHPDAGGDAEVFKEMAKAYTILSNDKLRIRYDQTGEEQSIDQSLVNAIALVKSSLFFVINTYKQQTIMVDIIKEMKKELNHKKTSLMSSIKNEDKCIKDLEKIKSRLSIKKKKNVPEVLIVALDDEITNIRRKMAVEGEQIDTFEIAETILSQYYFNRDMIFGNFLPQGEEHAQSIADWR